MKHPRSSLPRGATGSICFSLKPVNWTCGKFNDRRTGTSSSLRRREPNRRPWVGVALAVAAIVGLSVGIPYYLYARVHESTDDAFIEGHVVPISPRVAGHVAKIHVEDNQWVNKGDLLVELNPKISRLDWQRPRLPWMGPSPARKQERLAWI